MADLMWPAGPQQLADYYPWQWAVMGEWARAPFYPQYPPMDPQAMSTAIGVLDGFPVLGKMYQPGLINYWNYYSAFYKSSPPGNNTATPTVPVAPPSWSPPYAHTTDWWGRFQAMWTDVLYAGNEAHAAKLAINLVLDRMPAGITLPPVASNVDSARTLAAIYYLCDLLLNTELSIDSAAILEGISAAKAALAADHASIQTSVNTLHSATINGLAALENLSAEEVESLVQAGVVTLTGEIGESADLVLAAIDALPDPTAASAGAPVWPGIDKVTLGESVDLVDGLHLTTAMDGLIISITTPPTRTGMMNIGGAPFDYREGQLAFENDEGHLEMWQYLGFRSALYAPRTMLHASGVRIRVLAGAAGTCTPWTVTP